THEVGGADVVEAELARASIAGDHADHQKHQQQGRAEAQRQQARQDAGHDQNRAEKDGYADRVEGGHARSQITAEISAPRILIVAAVGGQGRLWPRRQCAPRSSRPGVTVRRTASLPLAYVPGMHDFAALAPKRRGWPGIAVRRTASLSLAYARSKWGDNARARWHRAFLYGILRGIRIKGRTR